jgi:hypothetical protein
MLGLLGLFRRHFLGQAHLKLLSALRILSLLGLFLPASLVREISYLFLPPKSVVERSYIKMSFAFRDIPALCACGFLSLPWFPDPNIAAPATPR